MANVHVARARGTPLAADDAKVVLPISIYELQHSPPKFAFDHGAIVSTYVKQFHPVPAPDGGVRGRRSWLRRPNKSTAVLQGDALSVCPMSRTEF